MGLNGFLRRIERDFLLGPPTPRPRERQGTAVPGERPLFATATLAQEACHHLSAVLRLRDCRWQPGYHGAQAAGART